MCDLIDLDSPDPRKLITDKLASPLIPVPANNDNDKQSTFPNDTYSLNNEKCNSLDNNPFDTVLQEITEYARKKEDPFEIVLEKALKSKNLSTTPKACHIEFKDDFTPKHTRHSDILKMNKTLDDSLMNIELSTALRSRDVPNIVTDDSANQGLNNTSCKSAEVCTPSLQMSRKLLLIEISTPSSADLSILNQSAMNDSLSEASGSFEEKEIKSLIAQRVSMCIEKGALDAKYSAKGDKGEKPFKLRRSLSQDGKVSRKLKPFRQRSQSIIETLKANMIDKEKSSISSTSPRIFDDPMNKAFLLSQSSRCSDSSTDISNISPITRLNSVSSAFNYSSSVLSDGTINRAFIGSCSSVRSNKTDSTERSNLKSLNVPRIKSTNSIVSVLHAPIKTPVNVSDLSERYQEVKLRNAILEKFNIKQKSYSEGFDTNEKMKNMTVRRMEENQREMKNKLIDVDHFVPAVEENNLSRNTSPASLDSSLDSVFDDDGKIDKAIFVEARALAKTFEELAERTTSGSSSIGDDLINSRPRWNFDFLPLSDDESQVENLIELPVSPEKLEPAINVNADLQIINESKLLDLDTPKKDCDIIKELETEFIDKKFSEKKIMAATLLLDLEKLIKTENNPEAIALLVNLEKALGVKCENNSELLATCLCDANNLSKSLKKSDGKLESNDNMEHESIEQSREENADINSSEDIKELDSIKNTDLDNNQNTNKEINKSERSSILVSDKAEDALSRVQLKTETSSRMICDDSTYAQKKENEVASNQEMAVQLLIDLGKILNDGHCEESSPLKLLMNLGKVLNLATNQLNFESNSQTNSQYVNNRKDIALKKMPDGPKSDVPKSHQSNLLKSASRRSLDSATKTSKMAEKSLRRSISGSRTASGNNVLNTVTLKAKSEIKKRFSSNPETVKDIRVRPTVIPEIQKVKPSTVASTVRNKLRKKSDSDIMNKKGPMKAILPLGNMQRRGSLGKKVAPLPGQVTPPKSVRNTPTAFTIINSTPNPTVTLPASKMSPKNKPIASSTPDAGASKIRNGKSQLTRSSEKRNLLCNISPVSLHSSTNKQSNILKDTSNTHRHNKTLSPPKGQKSKIHQVHNMTESSIPKYSPQFGFQRKSSFGEATRSQNCSESPKVASVKSQLPQISPFSQKKSGSQTSQSPLKSSNKQTTKLKPFNLISKLRRRSSDNNIIEKENRA